MHYVKHFDINDVDTRQAACIELHGKPNAATEGYVGVLGIDMDSPLHEVYKCVAVNGSIYSWELLSSGMSFISASITGGGVESVQFPYANLRTPAMYVMKIGDLIFDKEGYLYQVSALYSTYCDAVYCDAQGLKGAPGESAYDLAKKGGYAGTEAEFIVELNHLHAMNETVQELHRGKAPTNHASPSTTYGTGSDTNYGHVKLSDATDGTSGATGGVAATPVAVKAAYDLAYTAKEAANRVPQVTVADNGKFLRVVDGDWAATSVPNAEGVSF